MKTFIMEEFILDLNHKLTFCGLTSADSHVNDDAANITQIFTDTLNKHAPK